MTEPVMTTEEWERVSAADPRERQRSVGQMLSAPFSFPIDVPRCIAILNAALPDSDPRKITRRKIKILRIELSHGDTDEYSTGADTLEFIDALESYLPPTEGT